MLTKLKASLRRKKMLLLEMIAMTLVMLIPLFVCAKVYRAFSHDILQTKLAEQNSELLTLMQKEYDELILQAIRIGVTLENDAALSSNLSAGTNAAAIETIHTLSRYSSILAKSNTMFLLPMGSERIYTSSGTYYLPLYMSAKDGNALVNPDNVSFIGKFTLRSGCTGDLLISTPSDALELWYPLHSGRTILGFHIPCSALYIPKTDGTVVLLNNRNQILYRSDPSFTQEMADTVCEQLEGRSMQTDLMFRGISYTAQIISSEYSETQFLYLMPNSVIFDELYRLDWQFVLIFLLVIVLESIIIPVLTHIVYRPILKLKRHAQTVTGRTDKGKSETEYVEQEFLHLFSQYSDMEKLNLVHRRREAILSLTQENDPTSVISLCHSAGLPMEGSMYRYMIAQYAVHTEHCANTDLDAFFVGAFPFCSVYSAPYRSTKGLIFLLIYPASADSLVVKALDEVIANSPIIIHLGVGQAVEQPQELVRSYAQAYTALGQLTDESLKSAYAIFSDQNNPASAWQAVYLEINALYNSLIAGKGPESRNLLKKLISFICAQEPLPIMLCYEISRTMLKAGEEDQVIAEILHSSPSLRLENLTFLTADDFASFSLNLLDIIISHQHSAAEDCFGECCKLVQLHLLESTLCPETLADELGISLSSLNRIIKEHTSRTPAGYILYMRQTYAKKQLIGSDITVNELAQQLGYSQPSSFIRTFKREEGVTPGEYRQQHTFRGSDM